jgi:hypothetical protein
MGARLDTIDARLDTIDARLDRVDKTFLNVYAARHHRIAWLPGIAASDLHDYR